MTVLLVNRSQRVAQPDLVSIAQALQLQWDCDFSFDWRSMPEDHLAVPGDVPFGDSRRQIIFTDEPPVGERGVLGEHVGSGSSFIYVNPILDNGGGVLAPPAPGAPAVSGTASHENVEAGADDTANLWADNGNGVEIAYESADPTEGDLYPVQLSSGVMVWVSNYVTREWFRPGPLIAGRYYDKLKLIASPFTMRPGGYWIERAVLADAQQSFASISRDDTQPDIRHHGVRVRFGPDMPAWKIQHKLKTSLRMSRRGVVLVAA